VRRQQSEIPRGPVIRFEKLTLERSECGLCSGSCLSSGGKVQRVIIPRDDVTYAAFFTSFIS
jgi:hypothetical protein